VDFGDLPEAVVVPKVEAELTLVATVSDTAGQKQVRKLPVLVTTQPLRVELMAESGVLVRRVPNTIFVLVTRADGRPAKARIAVSDQVKELLTNDLGVASFAFTPTSDATDWTVRATADDGRTVQRHFALSCGTAANDFLVRTDRAVYSGGEAIQLSALGAGGDPIFVDLLKDGQTLLTDTIPMSAGGGTARLDLPADVYGTVQLSAYRFSPRSGPLRKTRVLYIRPPAQLQIAATMDRPEYRPGEQARGQFTLTDKDGKPAPGALSLAAVDEAVFSVLGQSAGSDAATAALEPRLLRRIHEVFPWSPGFTAKSAADQRLFEQALFARTAGHG